MQVYIQTNSKQFIASKICQYSFERFGLRTHLINFEFNSILKKKVGNLYLRNGQKMQYLNDLQSFTLLRFLAPEINKYKDQILIIDPDVFAIKNPNAILNELDNNFDIFCTFYNELPRSEVMLIKANNVDWKFEKIVDDLFNFKVDYRDLMNLSFVKQNKIKKIPNKFNSHDLINEDTIMLHTTNRITQPWKEGLKIDFQIHNKTALKYFVNYFKKIVNIRYDEKMVETKYVKHPSLKVIECVKNIFLDAYRDKYINDEEIDFAIKSNHISRKFADF